MPGSWQKPNGGRPDAGNKQPDVVAGLKSEVKALKAFVVLPHCMQVSARFWSKVGFQLGEKVDAKEHKQATLRKKEDLGAKPRWSFRNFQKPQ